MQQKCETTLKANSDSKYKITNLTKYKTVLDQTIPLSRCQLNVPRDSRVMFCRYTESGQMQLKKWMKELCHLLCIGINIGMYTYAISYKQKTAVQEKENNFKDLHSYTVAITWLN